MSAWDDAYSSKRDHARRHRLATLLESQADEDRSTSTDGDGAVAPGTGAHGAERSASARRRARLGRVCAVSVTEAGVSGAGVTAMGSVKAGLAGQRDQLWATSALARRLEDLQLTAGEGPCLDAHRAGTPVLVGDLAGEQSRWLGFAPEAMAAGAAAAFSLPLQVGAIRMGTLDLHRTTVGPLSRPQLADALVLATLAAETLLELVLDPDLDPDVSSGFGSDYRPDPDGSGDPRTPGESGWLPDVHAEVHQASGMVAAREDIGVGEALLRMRGHAFAHGAPIHQVAQRIVDRSLVLDDHHPPDEGPESPDMETDR